MSRQSLETSALMDELNAAPALPPVAQRAIDIHVGDEWMTHAEMAALCMPGTRSSEECPGSVRFVDLAHPIKEAACDAEGCDFTITAYPESIAASMRERDQRWYQQ